ncbi:MAG TPA: antibiotic biosynthesis monooxygenase [Ktedonobacterales bacterium]|jgi:quinol monooxygenase YgiN
MTLVVMKAEVPREQWEALTRAFDEVMENRPDGIVESILAQDQHDPTLWRIITIWESQAALDAYSASYALIPGAQVFHLVGVTPIAMVNEVFGYVQGKDADPWSLEA